MLINHWGSDTYYDPGTKEFAPWSMIQNFDTELSTCSLSNWTFYRKLNLLAKVRVNLTFTLENWDHGQGFGQKLIHFYTVILTRVISKFQNFMLKRNFQIKSILL